MYEVIDLKCSPQCVARCVMEEELREKERKAKEGSMHSRQLESACRGGDGVSSR